MKISKITIFLLVIFIIKFCEGNVVKAYIENSNLLVKIESRLDEKIQNNPNYIEREFATVRPIPPRAKID